MMRPSDAGGGCPLLRGGGKDLQSWDNFLDFSRFTEPRCGPLAKRRLTVNLQTFALNYVISAFLGMISLGFFLFNRWVVFAASLLLAVYHLGLLVPAFAPSDLQMPSTKEKAFLMVMTGNVIFFQFGNWASSSLPSLLCWLWATPSVLVPCPASLIGCTITMRRRQRKRSSSIISEMTEVPAAAASEATMPTACTVGALHWPSPALPSR